MSGMPPAFFHCRAEITAPENNCREMNTKCLPEKEISAAAFDWWKKTGL